MNMVLLFQDDFIDDKTVRLTGRRHEHIRTIIKPDAGDTLQIGILDGQKGEGRVIEMQPDSTLLEVSLMHDPDPKVSLVMVVALPRPPVFRRLLSAMTAFGVEKIIFIQTTRVEKSYWNSPVLTAEAVRQDMILGLEQAKDTVLPEACFYKRFKPFVEDELPALLQDREGMVAHPENAVACPSEIGRPMLFAVGPEGGFVDYEIQRLKETGLKAVHFGPRILRVETVVQGIIGRIMKI